MSYQDAGGIWLPAPLANLSHWIGGTGLGSLLIDAVGEKVAFTFRCPHTGDLETVGFNLGTVTTWQDLKISFQDVSLATGDPDGTADQFRVVTGADTDDNVWKETGIMSSDGTDTGVKRSVTVGQLLAVVIEFNSTTGNLNIRVVNIAQDAGFLNSHLCSLFAAASWSKSSLRQPCISLKYSDGTYPIFPMTYPFVTMSSSAINTGSTPDEAGLIFQRPFPFKAKAAYACVDMDGDAELVIYDSDGTTPLVTQSFDLNVRPLIPVATGSTIFFAEQTFLANTNYRLVLKPSSVTSATLMWAEVNNAAYLGHLEGGTAFHWTQRTDAGAWSETTTRRPFMGLLISALDDGVGGGAAAWWGN